MKDIKNFRYEISKVINEFSAENGSDTPDFILARYLTDCLEAFDRAVQHKNEWDSPDGVISPEFKD